MKPTTTCAAVNLRNEQMDAGTSVYGAVSLWGLVLLAYSCGVAYGRIPEAPYDGCYRTPVCPVVLIHPR